MKKLFLISIFSLSIINVYAYDFIINNLAYNVLSRTNKEVEITFITEYGNDYEGNIIIPPSVNYMGIDFKVVRIGENAFQGCEKLYSLEIPNTVRTIGFGAFRSSEILSIILPNSIYKIEGKNLSGCGAFDNCYRLKEITLPSSLRTISEYIFEGCDSIEYIHIENTKITKTSYYCFSYCDQLKEIIFPETLEYIEEGTCKSDTSLIKIIIPFSVNFIGSNAFGGCKNIKTIIVNSPLPPDVDNDKIFPIFENIVYNNAILYVPVGCIEIYKESKFWKNFLTIKEIDDYNVSTNIKKEQIKMNNTCYTLGGMKIVKSLRGIYINNGKKVIRK